MTQYLIFLKNDTEENCCLVSSNKDNAIQSINDLRNIVKRENAWFELREYDDAISNEYTVLNV